MPLSTAVFDPLVFDVGTFDALDITPYLFKVAVEPSFRRVVPGQSLTITLHIKNAETTPGRKFDYNPGEFPEVELYQPGGALEQAYTTMYNVSIGVYGYQHTVGTADPVGFYTGRFKAENGNRIMLTPKIFLFEVLLVT